MPVYSLIKLIIAIFAPMKHLVIRNLGPLKEADVELKRINVIIG